MSQPIPGVNMLLSHRACFFLVCVYSVTIPNSSPNPQQPFPSLTINIHNGQQQNQSATATSDVESSLKNSSTSSAKANNKPDNSWIHYLHDFYNRACSKKDDGISFLKNHPFKIMGGTFMCCYFYLVCKIKQCKKMIYSPESWCCWNSSIETTELTMFPYSKVHNQLIEDIQKKYLMTQDKIDFSDPLEQFMRDIKKEIGLLMFYIKLHKIIVRWRVPVVFFLQNKTLLDAQDRLKRIKYMYDIFVEWHTKRGMLKEIK